MRLASVPALGLVGTIVVGGCSSSRSGATFRCDRTDLAFHVCSEYDDLDSAALAGQEANCTRSGETAVTACPNNGLLGTCTLPSGGLPAKDWIYSDVNGKSDSNAAMFCAEGSGTWRPVDGGSNYRLPFACGPATTCTGTQFCWEHQVGSILYACPELPPSCAASPTCGCLLGTNPGSLCASPMCTDDGAGHLTVLCVG